MGSLLLATPRVCSSQTGTGAVAGELTRAASALRLKQMRNNVHVPDELLAELRVKAQAEGKSVDELAENAFRQYLENDQWRQLLASKRMAAAARGLTEADVPRLVEEARRERRAR